jgi:hypothetical protein
MESVAFCFSGGSMEIKFRELKRHYASLSEEELLAVDRGELTKAAQEAYDNEIANRGLNEPLPVDAPEVNYDMKPDWSSGSVCICSFLNKLQGAEAEKIAKSRAALKVAGIPNELTVTKDEESGDEILGVIVPTMFATHASAILDRDVVNEEYAAEWRVQLESLSDEDLKALDPKIFCVGLLDRIARIRRAYSDEMQRRKLAPRPE